MNQLDANLLVVGEFVYVNPCCSNYGTSGFCWWVRKRHKGLKEDEGQPGYLVHTSVVIAS